MQTEYIKIITTTELRKNLEKYLEEAKEGSILITFRGKPSLVLCSIELYTYLNLSQP